MGTWGQGSLDVEGHWKSHPADKIRANMMQPVSQRFVDAAEWYNLRAWTEAKPNENNNPCPSRGRWG